MSGTKLLPGGSALMICSLYSTTRAVVVTGGFKLGMMIALSQNASRCQGEHNHATTSTSNTRQAPPRTKLWRRSDEPVWQHSLEDAAFTNVEVPVVEARERDDQLLLLLRHGGASDQQRGGGGNSTSRSRRPRGAARGEGGSGGRCELDVARTAPRSRRPRGKVRRLRASVRAGRGNVGAGSDGLSER